MSLTGETKTKSLNNPVFSKSVFLVIRFSTVSFSSCIEQNWMLSRFQIVSSVERKPQTSNTRVSWVNRSNSRLKRFEITSCERTGCLVSLLSASNIHFPSGRESSLGREFHSVRSFFHFLAEIPCAGTRSLTYVSRLTFVSTPSCCSYLSRSLESSFARDVVQN